MPTPDTRQAPRRAPDVWVKSLTRNRGAPRLYLDGLQAVRTGFAPGESYDVEVAGSKLVLRKKTDGSRTVSMRRKGEREFPVLDINSAELLSIFEGMDAVRVVVGEGSVTFLPLASEAKRLERLQRLRDKLASGEPLKSASLAHGGGVLSHAIHEGLRQAGVQCELAFANELRDDLLEQAIANNDAWSEDTAAIGLPMQEIPQDDWLMGRLSKVEILEAGIPCSGASLAGHTRNGLKKMEDHEQVGHLAFSALMIIMKVQPAVILLENVPRYKDTASAQVLRLQLRDMGYTVHEAELSGKDFGCMEDRVRWCMVGVTRGVEFSFEQLAPPVRVVQVLRDVLDPQIGLDDPRWREVQYLKDKEVRNAAAGDRFKMQMLSADAHTVPTLRKGYHKGGSSDPRLMHPQNPNLSRLLTAAENGRIKGVPAHLFEGLSETTALQLLGQGVVYEPFRAVGERIGRALLETISANRAQASEVEPSAVMRSRQRMTG